MQIVESLYNAFSDAPRPAKIEGCRHCIPEEDIQTLLGQKLRECDPKILWRYMDDAIWTVGNELDFKYYVPRILELGLTAYNFNDAQGSFIAFPETFGKKLALAGFNNWDEAKRVSVDNVIFAIMKEEARRQEYYNFEGWMCAICNINVDKTRYLDFLDSEAGQNARDSFLVSHRSAYTHKCLQGEFWDELDAEKTNVVYQWLLERKDVSDIALGRHRRAQR